MSGRRRADRARPDGPTRPDLLLSLLTTGTLTAALIVTGFVAPSEHVVVTNPWGTECELDWCQPKVQPHIQPYDPLADLTVQAQVDALTTGRECYPAGEWSAAADGAPTNLVILPTTGGPPVLLPFEQAWEYAQTVTGWSLLACAT